MRDVCRDAQREGPVALPIWQELLIGVELTYLRISPVYWGYGVPRGNGSGVVVIPGLMLNDAYLSEFRAWLSRIGYKPYGSGIGVNAECPNLLIRKNLRSTIEAAYKAHRRKIHVVGHSLGGLLALAAAAEMPDKVASVITLASPFRGVSVHPSVYKITQMVRQQILEEHGDNVLPACYTSQCTCNFLQFLMAKLPKKVNHTAIYTKADGLVDWQACVTGNEAVDIEVSGTHVGMVFNPLVYSLVAHRLAGKRPPG
jgi:triacylglycerol lipase